MSHAVYVDDGLCCRRTPTKHQPETLVLAGQVGGSGLAAQVGGK